MPTIIETLARLRAAGARVSELTSPVPLAAPIFGSGCCAGELDELQESFRKGLPNDYLEYLSLCRRVIAPDVFNGYFIYSPLSLVRVDSSVPRFLDLTLSDALQEVWVVSIGGDGGGNQFLMGITAAARGYVWKWSNEFPPRFDGMVSEGLTMVANSFSAFLERVAEDWERFAANDQNWQHLSR